MVFKDLHPYIKEHENKCFFLSNKEYSDEIIDSTMLVYTYNGIRSRYDIDVAWRYLYIVDGEKALHPTAIEGHQFLTITEIVKRIDLKEVKNGRSNT